MRPSLRLWENYAYCKEQKKARHNMTSVRTLHWDVFSQSYVAHPVWQPVIVSRWTTEPFNSLHTISCWKTRGFVDPYKPGKHIINHGKRSGLGPVKLWNYAHYICCGHGRKGGHDKQVRMVFIVREWRSHKHVLPQVWLWQTLHTG